MSVLYKSYIYIIHLPYNQAANELTSFPHLSQCVILMRNISAEWPLFLLVVARSNSLFFKNPAHSLLFQRRLI